MSDFDLPLKGPALYNPRLLSKQELLGLFSARQALLEELLNDLRSTPPGETAQHHLIVGQRGMGKTMLLRRIQFAIDDDPELRETWLALSFPEEQYNVAGLSDFWLNCLDALSDTLERLGQGRTVEGLDQAVDSLHELREEERARHALGELVSAAAKLDRRLLLLVDNADLVLDRIGDQEWSLRETLSSQPAVTFLGASSAAIESTYQYDKAFYDFFRIHDLSGLSIEETRTLLLQYATLEGRDDVRAIIEQETGRVRTLHTLTGGNPRTLALLFNIFAQGPDGDVRTDLERLLDQCTPLYKARFEALPAQAQQVVDALALRWDPTPAGELAKGLRLPVNAVSAQLNRLTGLGIVEKVPYEPATKTGFQIAERFFNIWYLMRASRRVRRRLVWLVEFLKMFYGQDKLRRQARHHLELAARLAPLERLHQAESLFALASASEDDAFRGTLERGVLQILASQKELRRHLAELVDLDSGDTGLENRAEYLERFEALRDLLADAKQREGISLEAQVLEKLRRAPVPLGFKEVLAKALIDSPSDEVEEHVRTLASLEDSFPLFTESPRHKDDLLRAIEQGTMTALDDIEGAKVAEEILGVGDLVAIAATVRAEAGATLEIPAQEEESLAALKAVLPRTNLAYPWTVWLRLVGQTLPSERLEEIFDKIADLPAGASNVLTRVGSLLSESPGWATGAEKALRKAIEIDPENADAWKNLGISLEEQHREQEAEDALRRAIDLDPEQTSAHFSLGELLQRQSRLDEAEQVLRAAVDRDSSNPWAWQALANLFVVGNHFKKAEEALRRAIGEDPKNAWSWTLLGVLLRIDDRLSESEHALREAILADQQNAHAKNALASLLLKTDGDLAEAESLACEAAQSEGALPSMSQTLAQIQARQGKWPLAEKAARRFLEAWSDQVPDGLWPDVVAFFREAAAAGRAKEAIALLESVNLGERWRPLKEALEVIARQSPEYLRRVAPEVRRPAEALVEELTGEATGRE